MAGAAVTNEENRSGEQRSAAPTATSTISKTRIADELKMEHSPRQNASQHILGSAAIGPGPKLLAVTSRSMNRESLKATGGRSVSGQPLLGLFLCEDIAHKTRRFWSGYLRILFGRAPEIGHEGGPAGKSAP